MVQLVAKQVESNPKLVTEAAAAKIPVFDMLHISLLNQESKGTAGSGWRKDEEVFMQDMNAIFEEFRENEMKLVFDVNPGDSVYTDGDGIHLPVPKGATRPTQPVTLKCYFFNISVQGNTHNTGTQAAINNANFDKLMARFGDQFLPNFSTKLNDDTTDKYALVPEVMKELLTWDFALSIGCMSAKDRTGKVAHDFVHKQIDAQLEKGATFRTGGADYDWIQCQVAYENNQTQVGLKVDPRFVSGATEKAKLAGRLLLAKTGRKQKPPPLNNRRVLAINRKKNLKRQSSLHLSSVAS